jgi:hypothetical protein
MKFIICVCAIIVYAVRNARSRVSEIFLASLIIIIATSSISVTIVIILFIVVNYCC